MPVVMTAYVQDAYRDTHEYEAVAAVAQRLGFEISDHALILYGHCRKASCPHKPVK